MSSSECVNTATLAKDSRIGILSKTGSDAKKMFTDKVVPINNRLPFFFKPIMDGMDKPKTELSYRVPASKITKNNMYDIDEEMIEGLDTTIDWKNTDDNSYDGGKLLLLAHDESGKWIKPNNILNNWRVTKTCLRLGSKIIGKCMMGSTSNALSKGGGNFKQLFYDSDVFKRNKKWTNQKWTIQFIYSNGMEYGGVYRPNMGCRFLTIGEEEVEGINGDYIYQSALNYWENEVDSLKNDPDALNEYYRQFPRSESHAFRDESKQSLFNLTRIYQQIDYNDSVITEQHITRGSFQWKDGVKEYSSNIYSGPKRKVLYFVGA